MTIHAAADAAITRLAARANDAPDRARAAMYARLETALNHRDAGDFTAAVNAASVCDWGWQCSELAAAFTFGFERRPLCAQHLACNEACMRSVQGVA